MSKRIGGAWTVGAMAVLAIALAWGGAGRSHAQSGLRIGGGSANFGVHALVGGFLPDPATFPVTSGGTLDASTLGLAPGCRGWVTAQPDVIVRYANASSFLRFFVRAAGDTTLVINDARGHWWCSDDDGGYPNPMIDLSSPPSGQYDVWIGSYRSGEAVPAQLFVTELPSQRP